MQASPIKHIAISDVVQAAPGDRAWQRSLGASGLLHGAVIAAFLLTWHIEPRPLPELRPIPITLVHTDEMAPDRAAQPIAAAPEQLETPPAQAAPPETTPEQAAAPPPAPTPPQELATAAPPPPVPPTKPPRVAPATAKPAPPPVPTPTSKPDAAITALLSESLDGRPNNRTASQPSPLSAIALRSSAKLSDDYLLHLQAWIARQERYPTEARAKHQEGKGVVGFTIARDGKVTRAWIDQTTGSSLLDQASIATIRDSSPVPPLPHDITGDSVDFYLPVNYTLSNFERLFR